MNYLDVVILGIVEGFTEFLPISSTAHLIITSALLEIPSSAFLSSFIIAIQLGAIASVVAVYWRTIVFDRETMQRVAVAFIPTAIIGFVLYKTLKSYLIDNMLLIACALLVGGVILVVYEYMEKRESTAVISDSPIPYGTAFIIGCAQALAIIPGVSRAGATILSGLMLGISRAQIVEFSFLLAIPTMITATAYDLYKSGSSFAAGEWELLGVGFIVSAIAAYAAVRFLIKYISNHTFEAFGWYRIALGIVILAYLTL